MSAAAKRPRVSGSGGGGGRYRIELNVGGTAFSTTKQTVDRCSYMRGLVDSSAWDADDDHVAEFFVDRDPEIFASLLRLMRQVPLLAGLLPSDREKFAALLAEADFFGFDAFLEHVKARAFYHTAELAEEAPIDWRHFIQDQSTYEAAGSEEKLAMKRAAFKTYRARRQEVAQYFADKDEAYGSQRFDVLHGSIGDALASGILPTAYFAPPKHSIRILQLLPVEATTWFLIGDAHDDTATITEGARYPDDDTMKHLRDIVQRPFLVRRVACHALMEREQNKQWTEPMLYIGADDMEEWMNHQPSFDGVISSRDMTMTDPACPKETGGSHVRTMLASKYMEHVREMYHKNARRDSSAFWTHLLVAPQPPAECDIRRSDLDQVEMEAAEANA